MLGDCQIACWQRLRRLAAAGVLSALCLTAAASGAGGSSQVHAHARRSASATLWGLAGPYQGTTPQSIARSGVQFVLVDLLWSAAEPAPHVFNQSYFDVMRYEIGLARSAHLEVVLGSGLEEAPPWLLKFPGARFVDQRGTVYRRSHEPNLVFGREYRPYAAQYLQKVFQELGRDFLAVRIGGGHFNELTYPRIFADGRWQNDYWAFDRDAQKEDPVPGWKPGERGDPTAARRFLTWYIDSLTGYQNWQIATVRRYYSGEIGVLYGSYGMRPGEFERAVTSDLSGTSPAEQNGEVQSGHDLARQLSAITDPQVAIWITWADNPSVVEWLAPLARAHHLDVWGENVGMNSTTTLLQSVSLARRYLDGFMWVRASQAYCRCNGWATIDDYSSAIGSAA